MYVCVCFMMNLALMHVILVRLALELQDQSSRGEGKHNEAESSTRGER